MRMENISSKIGKHTGKAKKRVIQCTFLLKYLHGGKSKDLGSVGKLMMVKSYIDSGPTYSVWFLSCQMHFLNGRGNILDEPKARG